MLWRRSMAQQARVPRGACRSPISLRCRSLSVGIDLGTTSSAIAYIREDGKPAILEDNMGKAIIPSVVAYHEDGSVSVGNDALESSSSLGNTFYSVKRLIGQEYKHVEELAGKLSYQVAEANAGGVELVVTGKEGSKNLLPEEVSAHILRHLVARATERLGQPVTRGVIAIPAHFSKQQQEATKEAGRLAGLESVLLLQEPVAAAMAHGFGKPTEAETILVFDLGGGTFDVSVLDSFEGIMEVLSTGGDSELGGDDFTRTLAEALGDVEPPEASSGDALTSRGVLVDRSSYRYALFRAADEAKRKLSGDNTVEVVLPRSSETKTLTREEMETLWSPLIQKLWPPLAEVATETFVQFDGKAPSFVSGTASATASSAATSFALFCPPPKSSAASQTDRYKAPPRKLTGVVLVGAATLMPCVQNLIKSVTGITPAEGLHPEEVVALGAAVHAGILQGNSSGLELMDSGYNVDLQDRITGL